MLDGDDPIGQWRSRGLVYNVGIGLRGGVRWAPRPRYGKLGEPWPLETWTLGARYGAWAWWNFDCYASVGLTSLLRRGVMWCSIWGDEWGWQISDPGLIPMEFMLAGLEPVVPEPRSDTYQGWGTAFALCPVAVTLPVIGEDLDPAFVYSRWAPEVTTTRNSAPWAVPTFGVAAPVRRLRVTSGVVLPSDVAIHVICGSKDVIHSWAIPGLGIKIDCIPGYNCHRRLLVRWRGLFWGQCMEVCGRYHH